MKVRQNIVKGWITSIVGLVVMLLTVYFLFKREINFMWEGTIGLCLGTILLLAPKTIERYISEAIKSIGGFGNNDPWNNPKF